MCWKRTSAVFLCCIISFALLGCTVSLGSSDGATLGGATTPPRILPTPASRTASLLSPDDALFVALLPTDIPFWSSPPREPAPVTLPPAPTDPDVIAEADRIYWEGFALYQNRQWEDAITRFNQAIELDPHHAAAYNYRGTSYRAMGASETSLSAYTASLD